MRVAFTIRRLIMLAAVVCWAALSSTSRGEEPLRWKFKVGEQLDYQMTQDMNMDMDAGPTGQIAHFHEPGDEHAMGREGRQRRWATRSSSKPSSEFR